MVVRRLAAALVCTATLAPPARAAELVARTGAQLWVGHSMEFFRTVRKSPAWYD